MIGGAVARKRKRRITFRSPPIDNAVRLRAEFYRLKVLYGERVFREVVEEFIAPPRARPGRTGWPTWAFVQAVMNVRNVGAPSAARILTADRAFTERARDALGNVFQPRGASSLERDYRTAEARRQHDPEFASECAHFLPQIESLIRRSRLG